MPRIFIRSMIVVVVVIFGVLGLKLYFRSPAIATKSEYLDKLTQQSSEVLCAESTFMAFNQCFEFSQESCQMLTGEATSYCVELFQQELPEQFSQAHERKLSRWESKIAQCTGEQVVKQLTQNKSESEKFCMRSALKR